MSLTGSGSLASLAGFWPCKTKGTTNDILLSRIAAPHSVLRAQKATRPGPRRGNGVAFAIRDRRKSAKRNDAAGSRAPGARQLWRATTIQRNAPRIARFALAGYA